MDVNGLVVASAYQAMALTLAVDAGIEYRYGPDSSAYGVGAYGVTLFEPTHHTSTNTDAIYEIGTRELPDTPSNQPGAGNYSTQQATVGFVSDDQTRYPGAINLQTMGHQFNTLEESPQQSWTTHVTGDGAFTDPSMRHTATRAVIGTSRPIAMGQGIGRYDHNRSRVIAFDTGLIGCGGSNTNTNWASTQLPAGLVPTGVAVSNCSEFAFVTCWDKVNVKGYVAVIALAGIPEQNTGVPTPIGSIDWYDNWGEWMQVYPGLPNWGDLGYMKVLGLLDLGTDMVAPTEIACTTGYDQFGLPWHFQYDNTPLTSHYTNFVPGGSLDGTYAKGGMLTVISKSEKKVAFIDLKPLFAFYQKMYFSTSGLNAQTNTIGSAANQWPYTFTNSPEQIPTVVMKVTLSDKPTAVASSAFGTFPVSWVATQGGTVRIYKLGTYAPGGSVQTPTSAQIGFVSQCTVGFNPTCLGTSKNEPSTSFSGVEIDQQVMVVCRGSRMVQWVRASTTGTSPSVVRTLRDSRLVDPIAVEDAENYATDCNICTVLDYSAKMVRNYRYGPTIYNEVGGNTPTGHPWGCQGPTGCPITATSGDTAGIESGGGYAVPGKPFQLRTANTP